MVDGAMILAAGLGTRMGGRGPKPLERVGGVALLERSVRALQEAGIERICVVVGHAGEQVEQFVRERELAVELVRCPDWERGNAASVACGARALGGRVLVMMGDTIYSPEVIRVLAASEGSFVLGVDRSPAFGQETTPVRLEGECVLEAVAGEPTGTVDLGLDAAESETLLRAYEALAPTQGSYNELKRQLGEIRFAACDGARWIDCDTQDEKRRAERLLSNWTRKQGDSTVCRVLRWRALSLPAARLAARAGLSPNQVSLLGFALGIGAAAVLALGSDWALRLGALLVLVAAAADLIDGDLARLTGRSSPQGALLDAVLDRYLDGLLILALAIAAGGKAWLFAVIACFCGASISYIKAKFQTELHRPYPARWQTGASLDLRTLVIALGALAAQPLAGLIVLALVTATDTVIRLWKAVRTPSDQLPS